MTNLLEDCRSLLESAGYATRVSRPDSPLCLFEDDSLLGFVRVFETPSQIVSGWQAEQDSFLEQHASGLLRDRTKAWNLYSVLLSRASVRGDENRALFDIEEDFRSTRKIARGGIRTLKDLEIALGALLPIRAELSLLPADVHARLLDRLGPSGDPLRLLLSADAPPEAIAKLLMERR